MYKCGDYVICKSGGVWGIIEEDSEFFKLKGYINDLEKIISINNDEIIRTICSKEDIEEAIDRVGFIQTLKAPNDKARKEIYDTVWQSMMKYHGLGL